MRIVVGNTSSELKIGGSDNLLEVDLLAELRDYLKVRMKGYQHTRLYKKRVWDGYTHFINKKGVVATGFLPKVIAYARELGAEIEIEDVRDNVFKLSDSIDSYIGEIDGDFWEGRDYQVKGVHSVNVNTLSYGDGKSIHFPRGILDYAPNAGKNSVSAVAMLNAPRDTVIVFTVSSQIIFNQAMDFFGQVFPKEEIGYISSKGIKLERITVVMAKTGYNRCEEGNMNVLSHFHKTNMLIVDESDEAGQDQYSKLIQNINAYMRFFVTGTALDGDVGTVMTAVGLSGDIISRITNKYLIENGYSQKPTVKVILNNSGVMAVPKYSIEEERYIHKSENRVRQIAEILRKHDSEQIMIVFNNTEHGEFMYDYLREHCHTDIKIAHGKIPDRVEIVEQFKKKKFSVLLVSMIVKRGANIPAIRVQVNAQGGKAPTTIKQVSGRATRHDGVHDEVLMYDFYDEGKYISKHSRDRIRIYKQEGFEVEYLFEQKRGKPL